MELFSASKKIFNSVNSVVKNVSGGKVDLVNVGKGLAKKAGESLVSKGKTKFQSMFKRNKKLGNQARRLTQLGVDVFHKAPQHLQNASSLLDTTTHALMATELGHTRFGSKLSDFNTKSQAAFNVIHDRHEQVANQLSQSNISLNVGGAFDKVQGAVGGFGINLGGIRNQALGAISQLPSY